MTRGETHWRVLLVDDDEDDFIITRDLLRGSEQEQVSLDWCGSSELGLAAICRQEHDLYLVDYRLGSDTGLELIHKARQAGVNRPM